MDRVSRGTPSLDIKELNISRYYGKKSMGKNKNKLTEERKKEVEFIDWALTKVSQGELRTNYYKLLKQYEKEYGRMDKD
jgi:hypothetical protein